MTRSNLKDWVGSLAERVKALYIEKDIMHDWSHIERVEFTLTRMVIKIEATFNMEWVLAGLYLHGIIYSHENWIREVCDSLDMDPLDRDQIILVAWESQKEGIPTTIEGKILHDAHLLEGGIYFEIIKSLITGSLRGQTLSATMKYIEEHLLNKGLCYTEVGKKEYAKVRSKTLEIFYQLREDLPKY